VIALRSRQRQQWLRQRQQSAVVSQSAVAASATIAPCVLFFLFTYTGWPTVPGLGAAVCWHSHAERMLLHEMPLLAAGFWIGMAGGAYRLSACASLVHVRDVYAWPQWPLPLHSPRAKRSRWGAPTALPQPAALAVWLGALSWLLGAAGAGCGVAPPKGLRPPADCRAAHSLRPTSQQVGPRGIQLCSVFLCRWRSARARVLGAEVHVGQARDFFFVEAAPCPWCGQPLAYAAPLV
jgi:hypothetical protein